MKYFVLLAGRVSAVAFALTMIALTHTADTFASQTHYKSGNQSSTVDTVASHSSNPAHIWTAVWAPVTAPVTSGGRFHDGAGCLPPGASRPPQCFPAAQGDYALDIGAAQNANAYFILTYGGTATGASQFIGYSSNISIYGVVASQSFFGTDVAACRYQKITIYVSWFDTSGGGHFDNVGWVVVGHLWPFTYSVGSWIYPDTTAPRGDGSGYVSYPTNRILGQVYPTGDPSGCSTGAHVHYESWNAHRYGATYERHGDGPDYYYYGHVEYVTGQPPGKNWGPINSGTGYSGPSSVGLGGNVLFLIGGNTTTDAMWVASP